MPLLLCSCYASACSVNALICLHGRWKKCALLTRAVWNWHKQRVYERDRLIPCDNLHLSFMPSHVYLRKQVVMSKESEISVWASMLCWSAEPLKVALKVKMISPACVITSVFEHVVEWTVKTHSKIVSYRHLVGQQWNCTDWLPV